MSEIEKEPYITRDRDGREYVTFGPEHTLADIVRWITQNEADAADIAQLLMDG